MHRAARERLVAAGERLLAGEARPEEVRPLIDELQSTSFMTRERRGKALRPLFEQHVRAALEDSVLTVEEERQLMDFVDAFSLGRGELDAEGWFTRVVQCAAVRDLLQGQRPRQTASFELEAGETVLWQFPDAHYLTGQPVSRGSAASFATSVPISHGLYYRVGPRQESIGKDESYEPTDVGVLGVTNRHLHFSGLRGRFRIPLADLGEVAQSSDGVRFVRRNEARIREAFVTGDGWFLVNLLTNAKNVPAG